MEGEVALVSISHEVASSGVRVPSAFCPIILSRLNCIEGTLKGDSQGAPIGCAGIKPSIILRVPPYFDPVAVAVGLAWVVAGAEEVGGAVVGFACVVAGADVEVGADVVGAVVVELGCGDEQLIASIETTTRRSRVNQTNLDHGFIFFITPSS